MFSGVSDFDRKVYEAVMKIPKGKVSTYGNVAKAAGSPRASRAVGSALHRNPFYGTVPCHRVVNRLGEVSGGFAFGGADIQIEMLENEGVVFFLSETAAGGKAVDLKKCLHTFGEKT